MAHSIPTTGDPAHVDQEIARVCALVPASHAHIPFFGHMKLETAGRQIDVLLGWRTDTDGPVTVLNWQTSPLASVFFANRAGDHYEIRVGERLVEGRVLSRMLVTFEHGTAVCVETDDRTLVQRSGEWHETPRTALFTVRRPGERVRATAFALDAAQQRAVDLPASTHILALGEAGCGKTTVALHRLAALRKRALEAGRRFRTLVLVPVEGLRRLSAILLDRLGATDTEIDDFDHWCMIQARKAFPSIPRRLSVDAPPCVLRVKRHPGLRSVLSEIASRSPRSATRLDLLHLFGDRVLLDRVAAASEGGISATDVASIIEHTRNVFRETTEQEMAHVDAERLATVDGRLIDAGTAMQDAGSIDPEDHPVLFALAARRSVHRLQTPDTYDAIVIDEAQEFAPFELEVIGRALRHHGTLIVAGDDAQQVDPTAYFQDWNTTMHTLGISQWTRVVLEVGYRCPPDVTALARQVIASTVSPTEPPTECSVFRTRESTECHLVARLCHALQDVLAKDPDGSVGIVCRTPALASRLSRLLSRGVDVRIVTHGDFHFKPGIEVTCVDEVKGLEFDYVLIPDADTTSYPDEPAARRAMYVALTRASARLLVTGVGSATRILPDLLTEG